MFAQIICRYKIVHRLPAGAQRGMIFVEITNYQPNYFTMSYCMGEIVSLSVFERFAFYRYHDTARMMVANESRNVLYCEHFCELADFIES